VADTVASRSILISWLHSTSRFEVAIVGDANPARDSRMQATRVGANFVRVSP